MALAALALLYGADYLLVRVRAAHGKSWSPFGTVAVIDETQLKNGQTEIFYRTPQAVTCVKSLFPHLGDSPCWVLRRAPMQPIG